MRARALPPPVPTHRPPASTVFDQAFILNLAGAPDRLAAAVPQFTRAGVVPTRVEAVLGASLSPADRASACTPACAARCTPAMVGVALSHEAVWRHAARTNRVALAAEDDVQLVDGWLPLLEAYAHEFPPDWDMVFLGCLGAGSRFNPILTAGGYTHAAVDVSEHVWRPPALLTLVCYLVSPAGARKLLAGISGRLDTHVDVMVNALVGSGTLNAYAVRPLLARQDMSLAVSSIADAKTPRGPALLADRVPLMLREDVTLGYGLAVPFARVGAVTVNAWMPVVAGVGTLLGLAGASLVWLLLCAVLLLALDVAHLLRGDWETVATAGALVALLAVGWAAGLGLRAGGGAVVRRWRQRRQGQHARWVGVGEVEAGVGPQV